ncbi:MAG: argininosuccinate synthase [Chloroflexi bacterium]|nr:argininosuccinate synthase [Chloroflexota bacterium]
MPKTKTAPASAPSNKKVVLAYSGGLDTSVILHWLVAQGYDVVAYTADVGQEEDFAVAREKALALGAASFHRADCKEEFVTDFIFPAIRANAAYEGRYLLGTSLARPLIAKHQIALARRLGAPAVAHGATGKGNDQVRFELTYKVLMPDVRIIAPWKDPDFYERFPGRRELLAYAKKNRIPVKTTAAKPWSSDANLMHISYEAGELEDPARRPRDSMFQLTASPQEAPARETELQVEFKRGNAVRAHILGQERFYTRPYELMQFLNQVGGANGIGRVDMVEDRYVGLKSRGVYETPGGTMLMAAHRDLEGLTLDREVMHLRDMLMPRFAELAYNGYWYSPEMEFLRAAFDKAQEHVTGAVRLALYKGNIVITGRESPESLYDSAQSSMDEAGGFDPRDSEGFIRTNALRLINWSRRQRRG